MQLGVWNTKVTAYGSIMEVTHFDNSFEVGMNAIIKKSCKGVKPRKEWSVKRAKRQIKILIGQNFTNKRFVSFMTLTFKENVTDVVYANRKFKSFMRGIRRYDPDSKYLAVIEFQFRGAVHYHVVISCKKIPISLLNRLWSYGYCHFHSLRNINSVSKYITKYLLKDVADLRLAGLKFYQCSKGLLRAFVAKFLLSPKLLHSDLPGFIKLSTVDMWQDWVGYAKMSIYEGLYNNKLNYKNYVSNFENEIRGI
jgi:hypothetical protein